MITRNEARIAHETLVDVMTPDETIGVVASRISTRKGVAGVVVDATNYEDTWYPLESLKLTGSGAKVVAQYL